MPRVGLQNQHKELNMNHTVISVIAAAIAASACTSIERDRAIFPPPQVGGIFGSQVVATLDAVRPPPQERTNTTVEEPADAKS
jgi:hypothetical protein